MDVAKGVATGGGAEGISSPPLFKKNFNITPMALHGKNRLEMVLVPSKMVNVPSSRRTVASPLDVATHVDGISINVETSTSPTLSSYISAEG